MAEEQETKTPVEVPQPGQHEPVGSPEHVGSDRYELPYAGPQPEPTARSADRRRRARR